jgi:hypothetical protein
MNCPPAIDALPPLFFPRDWDKSVWTRWLNMALFSGNEYSTKTMRCLLDRVVDLLKVDEYGRTALATSLASYYDLEPSVHEMMNSKAFAAHDDLQVDLLDPSGDRFLDRIIPNCSERIVRLWVSHGADPTVWLTVTLPLSDLERKIDQILRHTSGPWVCLTQILKCSV